LQVIRIDAPRRRKDDFPHFRTQGLEEDLAVQAEVRRRPGLMQIEIAATTVIGGEVEDDLFPVHRRRGDLRVAEVTFDEFDRTGSEVGRQVLAQPR
jgi:hypothetical protein